MSNVKNIGLVLSGGGIKGMAHLGLIKALEERGVFPKVLSGASIGALVSALYGIGMSPEEMLEFFKTHSLTKLSFFSTRPSGFFDSKKYQAYFNSLFPDNSFEKLEKQIFIATTNLELGESVIHSKGEIMRPLLASAAIPGFFSPLRIGEHLHADGGTMNNFPIEPLLKECDFIIGSYLSPPGIYEKKALNNVVKVGTRALYLALYAAAEVKFKHCQIMVEFPELNHIGMLSTGQMQEAFDIGYEKSKEVFDAFDWVV